MAGQDQGLFFSQQLLLVLSSILLLNSMKYLSETMRLSACVKPREGPKERSVSERESGTIL